MFRKHKMDLNSRSDSHSISELIHGRCTVISHAKPLIAAALILLASLLHAARAQDVSTLQGISSGAFNATEQGPKGIGVTIPNFKSAVIRFHGHWNIYGSSDPRSAGAAGCCAPAGGSWPASHAAEGCIIVYVAGKNFGCPIERNRLPDSASLHSWEDPPIYQMTVPGPGPISLQVNDDNVSDNRGAIGVEVFFADCSTCRPPAPKTPPKPKPVPPAANNNCRVGILGQTGSCNFDGAGVSNAKAYCETHCPSYEHGFCSPFSCANGVQQDATCGCYPPAGRGVITTIPNPSQ
jgi:hypothetical protein